MVKSLDDSVGLCSVTWKQRGLEENTIVIFTSDNGGYIGTDKGQTVPVTSNAPLRSGKGSLYEGGIRVPLIVRWPGVTPRSRRVPPARDPDGPVSHPHRPRWSDEQSKEPADGLDLKALLQEPGNALNREALYFHYPSHSSPLCCSHRWPRCTPRTHPRSSHRGTSASRNPSTPSPTEPSRVFRAWPWLPAAGCGQTGMRA